MKIIDFTKMKPNSKKGLVKCPKCGKIGELHKYTDGSACINHKGQIELGMFLNITEHCFFKNWQSEA